MLDLEEVVEGFARVLGALGSPAGSVQNLGRLVEQAVVCRPFVGNARLDRFTTLPPGAGILVLAMAAGMKRRLAFGTNRLSRYLDL